MNHRKLLYWIIPCILTILVAMQLARIFPQTSVITLARQGSSRVINYLVPPTRPAQSHSYSTTEPSNEHIRGLPAPPLEGVQKVDIKNDEGIRFDHLGPIVVNKDGTMSRITNWDKMAPIERENTLRILSKRNKLRMDKLKKDEDDADEKTGP